MFSSNMFPLIFIIGTIASTTPIIQKKNYFHTSYDYLMVDKSSVWMHNLLDIQKNEVCLLWCNHEY